MTGNDTKTCGSEAFPCKTLHYAVFLTGEGNTVYLYGRESERHPYGCEGRELLINKSINIIGLNTTASVYCQEGLKFKAPNASALTVTLRNLLFSNCSIAVGAEILNSETTFARPFHQIYLKNVTFNSVRGTAFSVTYSKQHFVNISVEDSSFVNNENSEDFIGAIVQIHLPGDHDVRLNGCLTEQSINLKEAPIYRAWKYKNHVQFRNTQFLNNTAYLGVVYLQNGEINFINCAFVNNSVDGTGGVLYQGRGNGSLGVQNTTFEQPKEFGRNGKRNKHSCFIHSESAGPLEVNNSNFITDQIQNYYSIVRVVRGGMVNFDSFTFMKCPIGDALRLDISPLLAQGSFQGKPCGTRVTAVNVFCERCSPGNYSLERGYSTGLHVHQHTCQPCPYGATCLQNITAKRNFWGYVSSENPPVLTFLPCPLDYCHPAPTSPDTLDFHSCYGQRTGELCGACARGYSEDLSTTQCRQDAKCHNNWFWFVTVAYMTVFALILIFKPPVLSFLWRHAFWFRQQTDNETAEEHFEPGYLKIVFYFYQVVDLLLITHPALLIRNINLFSLLIGLFNFRLRFFHQYVGCPFPGVTAVSKEFFLSVNVFGTVGCTFIIYVLHSIISSSGRAQRRPSPTLYLAIAMEIMLLGYERLAETSLSLLHCVPIGSEWRLFLDGNVHCWQWWQNALIVYITVFVAPFIMVLYFGSLQLYEDKLSGKEFLGACVFPLPFLVHWALTHIIRKDQAEVHCSDSKEIKAILHESFRPPTEEDKGTVYWESVLIGRRFVLLCLHAFIADHFVRLLCLDGACVTILAHHLVSRPYRSATANTCETVSLVALVAMATLNVGEAAFMSGGMEYGGPNESQALRWVEIALLGLVPGAFGVLFMLTCLSQCVRLVFLGIKGTKTLRRTASMCDELVNYQEEPPRPLQDPTRGE